MCPDSKEHGGGNRSHLQLSGNARALCKSQKIIMGDRNAKIGKEREREIVGTFGAGSRNERSESWIQLPTPVPRESKTHMNTEKPGRRHKKKRTDGVTINNNF